MKNWRNWIFILLFLPLLWVLFPKEIVKVEIKENEEKIDSLMSVIKEKSEVIDSLKRQKEKVIEKVITRVEKLKTLSPDSTILVFHNGIQTYGEIKSDRPILKEDSSVTCSLDNLRGANVVFTKYEGKLEETEILKNIIDLDSSIISDKDSIINENSIILSKTKEAYDQRLEELNAHLKKEIRKKKLITYGGCAILVGVVGGLLIFK